MNIEIPKIIWMLWFQGWNNAPAVVQKCKTTWQEYHPGWTIHFLTTENISDFIDLDEIFPGYKEKTLPPESFSNIIRMVLLIRYGGVWVDSTLYCNKSLDEWLTEYTAPSGFFAFANPGPDRLLSTWFLAASPSHIIIKKWYEASLAYWSNRSERHTYHWCHYLFGDLYQNDPVLRELWDKTPKLSADDPHYFLPYEEMFYKPVSKKVKRAIALPQSPVFKLTFKYDPQRANTQSIIHYLLSDKKEPDQTKTIIIAGMHRSGTSLTASLLANSGLDIGEDLLGAHTGNLLGHYENLDFLNFHRRILEKYHRDSDGWVEADLVSLEAEEEAEAKKIITLCKSTLWGWKDPRTTLFLNFWGNLIPDANFLFIYRSPEEVVDSLFRRATDPVIMNNPEKAIDTWIHYNKLILTSYEKFKDRAVLLHIKTLIHHYPECIQIINKKFNVDLNPAATTIFDSSLFIEQEINTGKEQQLFHYRPEAHKIYEELLSKSWFPSEADSRKEIERINANTNGFLYHWKEQHIKKVQLLEIHRTQLVEKDSEIAQLKTMVTEREDTIFHQQAELNWIKKTKFWKMRTVWQKAKRFFRSR